MALQTLNTIQSGVQSNYSDKYIKQALSNLGQRVGAKGDTIISQDFKITDIRNYNVNLNDVNYICVSYNPQTQEMDCIYNDNVLSVDESNLFTSLDITDIVNIYNIPIVEYVGNWNDLNNARIYKNHISNSYFVSGICTNNGVVNEIIVLEFSENGNNLLNGISIIADSNYVSFVNAKSIDGNIEITDNVQFTIQNSNKTYADIYEDVSNFVSVNEIIDFITDGSVVSETPIDVQFYKTKFQYYINVLPTYVKTIYNESIYFADNSFTGLKKYIIREFVKTLYTDSGFDPSDNNSFEVYFNKDYSFTCLVNSNTNGIYTSYDILVNFLSTDIDTNNLKTVVAHSNVDEKIIAYKFDVTYLDSDKYVDQVIIKKMYVLPYIKENQHKENVWVINDEETTIRTSGKDAGNPNIMMMSYVMANEGQQVSYATESVQIDVLHTYEENNEGDSFKTLLLQYTLNHGIEKSFKYHLPSLTTTVNNSGFFDFTITLPNINKIIEENTSFERIVQNTLMMTFVDLKISTNQPDGEHTLQQLLHGETDTTSYIAVYWNIVKNPSTGLYDWQSINNPIYGTETTSPVLDMGSMFSFTDFVDYYVHTLMEPDEYKHSWLVFDSMYNIIKNQTGENTDSSNIIHLVLKPDTFDYYSTSTTTVKYDGYANNLNFAPKFLRGKGTDAQGTEVNVITYKDSRETEILGIYDTPNSYSNITKFFELTDRKIPEISKVNNDFVPNSDSNNKYPMFDFREMLTLNQSLLNRLNIISIGPDNRVYNAYFGHATTGSNNLDYDYDVLAIGSYRQNHNMNSNITLTNSSNNFSVFDRIRFDLPTFNKQQAVFDKIVLKKVYGEAIYFATITVSNSNLFYINLYEEIIDNVAVDKFNVTKVTKYMNHNFFRDNAPMPKETNLQISADGQYYYRQYLAFNAAKYLNDMDKLGLIVFDDDPEYPRNDDNAFKADGYILQHIPEVDPVTELKTPFANVKMQSGFSNKGGIEFSTNAAIANDYSTFICYFSDLKYSTAEEDQKYKPKAVGENTGYTKNKLWLKLINVQEVITGAKYIQ